jgi:mannose-1-phosphate guanylyltransferase/mannose-1-phosphate guanylyltransferase/mannose-6-phosphate isomerase
MNNNPVIPVILCGGSGTRLWPISRDTYPKQFIPLVTNKPMIVDTIKRISARADFEPPVFISLDIHRFILLDELKKENIRPKAILLEPEGKNTAPAVASVALFLQHEEIDPIMVVLPADHVISNGKIFNDCLDKAIQYAKKDWLVTMGITPDKPETGFGYIKKGNAVDDKNFCFKVESFVEKPDINTARNYLESGEYLWNSGMFVFKTGIFLQELKKFSPEILTACKDACDNAKTDLSFIRLDKPAFSKSKSDSIDYAVMEKTDRAVVVPLDAGWSDVGSWKSLYEFGLKDANNNVISGDVIYEDAANCLIRSEDRLVAALGIKDLVIVDTPDALLVANKEQSQNIKSIVNILKDKSRNECFTHLEVFRPWGSYKNIAKGDRFLVKKIIVNPGAELSYQMHYHRAEHWVVVSGTAIVTKDGEEILLREDESIYLPLGVKHRLKNPGIISLEIIEVQTGSYLAEDDIQRFDDVYGRLDAT